MDAVLLPSQRFAMTAAASTKLSRAFKVDAVIGRVKAYCTHVGNGPSATENDATGERRAGRGRAS
jgi:adenylosuccinate synthase